MPQEGKNIWENGGMGKNMDMESNIMEMEISWKLSGGLESNVGLGDILIERKVFMKKEFGGGRFD